MNRLIDALSPWLVDVYLLSTALMLVGLAVLSRARQPARRLSMMRSMTTGLAAFVMLASTPGWPRVSRGGRVADVDTPTPRTQIPAAPSTPSEPQSSSVEAVPPTVTAALVAHSGPDSSAPNRSIAAPWPLSCSAILGATFLIGASTTLAWLALGAIQATRLRRSIQVATPRVQLLLAGLAGHDPRQPQVGQSPRIGLPVAIGVTRPMIVLPDDFAQREPDDRLEAALAHEWAHIRNGDLRWLALFRLLQVVWFAHPLFWWLRRAIRADQEALADAAAARLHGDGRLAYAETLIGWAQSALCPRPGSLASAALALSERPSLLQRRVRLLLDRDFRIEPTVSRRWRLATMGLGLAGALTLSLVTLRPVDATAQVMTNRPNSDDRPTNTPSGGHETGERFEYAGRVLDPDGKPFAGAKLYLEHFGYHGQAGLPVRAISNADGRFRFTATKRDFIETEYEEPWSTAQVVATAEGFGPGWADAFESGDTKVNPRNLTIRLASDDVPISGRLLDLEGRPVASASIRLLAISEPEGGGLSAWHAAATSGRAGSYDLRRVYLKRTLRSDVSGLPQRILSDAGGRFSIRGVGRERVIRLSVSGPTIQTKDIHVLTRASQPIHLTEARGSPDWGIALYYGADFVHAAAPTKPVVGIVKDKDTGKPLAGVRIACYKTAEFPVHLFYYDIETTSQRDGRYRLTGLPRGRGNLVMVLPPTGQPYLTSAWEVPDTAGLEPVSLDISLKRGVVIEGKVTDKTTGAPLKAHVEYNAFRDNPRLAEAPGFSRAANHQLRQMTEPDGAYRIVGLPGRGVVSASYRGKDGRYLTGIGLNDRQRERVRDLPVVPNSWLGSMNRVSEIDIPENATTAHCDLALEQGITRIVRVVGPEGKPVPGARLNVIPPNRVSRQPHLPAEFLVQGLRLKETVGVDAVHEGLKLAGTIEVRADQEGTVELQLVPWGTVVGRLVDEDGQPRPKVVLVINDRRRDPVTTDAQGRFRIEALIPGKGTDLRVSVSDAAQGGE